MKRDEAEAVLVECPRCRYTEIVYLPVEALPKCPQCGTGMVIRALLDEGRAG